MEISTSQLTKAAERLLNPSHSQFHKSVAFQHRQIAKAFDGLSKSHANTDPKLAECAKTLSKAHDALAIHHAAYADSATIEKPDGDETATKSTSWMKESSPHVPGVWERPYGAPGATMSGHSQSLMRELGYDPSVDLISKSAFASADLPLAEGDGNVLKKSAWE
jgi:hypothetical protein